MTNTTTALTLVGGDLVGVDSAVALALTGIVAKANEGRTVEATFTYRKQTKTPPRIAGEDYVALPGIGADTFFGTVVRVWRTKAGAFRFTMNTASRSDGQENGWITVIPAGVKSIVVTRVNEPRPAPATGPGAAS